MMETLGSSGWTPVNVATADESSRAETGRWWDAAAELKGKREQRAHKFKEWG